MPRVVSTPKAVPRPYNVLGGPRPPTLWEKIAVRKFLALAIGVHLLLALGASCWVVRHQEVTRKKFLPPAGSAEQAKKGADHKVSMGRKQSTMSAPEQAKRVVSNSSFAKVALPEMPEMPATTTDVFANRAIGLSGAGSAFGATGTPGGGAGGSGSGINFFGLRTRAKTIVFLVDVSGSMVMPLPDSVVAEKAGKSLRKPAPKGPETYKSLENEISRAIRSLDQEMLFSVVCFAADVESFKPVLVPASSVAKEQAIKWLQAHSPANNLIVERRARERAAAGFDPATPDDPGAPPAFNHTGTSSLAAFQAAFAMSPDAMCFVSDGAPTDGGYRAADIPPAIEALQQQLPKPCVINTVAFFADGGLEFMKELAAKNQGSFKEISPGMNSFGF